MEGASCPLFAAFAAAFYIRSRTKANIDRQIRNAFELAICLAESEPDTSKELSATHFKIVAKASNAFESYLTETLGGITQSRLAEMESLRSDDFGKEKSSKKSNKSKYDPEDSDEEIFGIRKARRRATRIDPEDTGLSTSS